MSKSSDPAGVSQHSRRSLGSKSKLGGIAVIVLVAVYSISAPHLNTRYGWNLPQIGTDAQGNVRLGQSPRSGPQARPGGDASAGDESDVENQNRSVRDRETSETRTTNPTESVSTQSAAKETSTLKPEGGADEERLYGLLREIAPDRFVSPAGLVYTPGSAEGHRLEHLRRHTKDDPGRPGPHGVFDGEMAGALKTIDQAYERAKKGQRTTKKVDDGRTIYTVDMGGRVGFVGGREGARKRNPMARRVRLVLEGDRVITAYPL